VVHITIQGKRARNSDPNPSWKRKSWIFHTLTTAGMPTTVGKNTSKSRDARINKDASNSRNARTLHGRENAGYSVR
jgi:hypothetical protein